MKLRTGEPWMSAPDYARSLSGLTIDLVVRDIDRSLHFQREVLATTVVYSDPDFAAVEGFGSQWMLHADHTYEAHPVGKLAAEASTRGGGIVLRLHGRDPDQAETAARMWGFKVLAATKSKPHGVREAYLIDPDGYVWAPDVPIKAV